jgi:hypothetical protein
VGENCAKKTYLETPGMNTNFIDVEAFADPH